MFVPLQSVSTDLFPGKWLYIEEKKSLKIAFTINVFNI